MTWFVHNWPQVIDLMIAHLLLSLPPIVGGAILATPLGLLAQRRPRWGKAILSATSVLYAVPALPMLIIIPMLFGLPLRSSATITIALTVYAVALLVRTAADAFASVDPVVRDAAIAIGHSSTRLVWQVDLPLALPVLLAGIRVVAVSTIGLVPIGALIGVSSLGTLLTDGFQRGIVGEVLTGVLATVALALIVDLILRLVGTAATPWTRRPRLVAPRTEVAA